VRRPFRSREESPTGAVDRIAIDLLFVLARVLTAMAPGRRAVAAGKNASSASTKASSRFLRPSAPATTASRKAAIRAW